MFLGCAFHAVGSIRGTRLSSNFNIAESEAAVEISKVFAIDIAAHAVRSRVDSWTVSPGLVSVQTFLEHIMPLPVKSYWDVMLCDK